MSDPRLSSFLARLRGEFPDFVVIALPFQCPDDDTIERFLHILDVPEEQLMSVTWRAIDIALEMYGDGPLPFALTTLDPETSKKHFAEELRKRA